MSWLDLFLQLFLAAAVYAVIQVLSRVWENRQACRVADDTAAPENNENPVAQDKPPLSVKASPKSPDKFSVIVKFMGSEEPLEIECSPSDRVIDVKSKIQELEGTHVKFQRLIFFGRPLENQSFLESCGVVDGDMMHLVSTKGKPMQVIVKAITGKEIEVHCDENDTVTYLKNKIEFIDGTEFECIRLLFNGKQLQDEKYLRHYNIEHNSKLFMVPRLKGGFSVYIRRSDGRMLTLTPLHTTIGDLKRDIRAVTGISVRKQVLILNGRVLEDAGLIKDYNILSECTIDLTVI